MKNMSEFRVLYDRDSDVLYISTRDVAASRGVEDAAGIVWRYDSEGDLIGATVVDFDDYWGGPKRAELAKAIAKRFSIPETAADTVLDHARDF
jgi:uncharacterized protein YuzE